ncbi:MAG: 18S rRNA maturation protein [Cirrosporium novae-zelandiae]|nr:MAG: 18S rRNA maturation protein [Cirrosporium novae-zelandiae]
MPPPTKRRRISSTSNTPLEAPAPLSTNKLKRQIRSLMRVLENPDSKIPATVRQETERALATYKSDLQALEKATTRKRMIKKYHMVRFFDRRKAEKVLKKLRAEKRGLGDDKEDKQKSEKLEKRISLVQVNLNYAIYYPLDMKYISLYPKTEKDKTSSKPSSLSTTAAASSEVQQSLSPPPPTSFSLPDASIPEKPEMWYLVQKCMANNTLPALRNGELTSSSSPLSSSKSKLTNKKNGKQQGNAASNTQSNENRNKRKRADGTGTSAWNEAKDMDGADSYSSDGGFFEE